MSPGQYIMGCLCRSRIELIEGNTEAGRDEGGDSQEGLLLARRPREIASPSGRAHGEARQVDRRRGAAARQPPPASQIRRSGQREPAASCPQRKTRHPPSDSIPRAAPGNRLRLRGSRGGRCGVSGRLIQPPKHDVRIGSRGLPTIPGKKELPISAPAIVACAESHSAGRESYRQDLDSFNGGRLRHG